MPDRRRLRLDVQSAREVLTRLVLLKNKAVPLACQVAGNVSVSVDRAIDGFEQTKRGIATCVVCVESRCETVNTNTVKGVRIS